MIHFIATLFKHFADYYKFIIGLYTNAYKYIRRHRTKYILTYEPQTSYLTSVKSHPNSNPPRVFFRKNSHDNWKQFSPYFPSSRWSFKITFDSICLFFSTLGFITRGKNSTPRRQKKYYSRSQIQGIKIIHPHRKIPPIYIKELRKEFRQLRV